MQVAVLPELSPVRTVADVVVGNEIRIMLADGDLDARVASVAKKGGRRS